MVRSVEWFNWLSGTVHAIAVRMIWRPEYFSDDPPQHPAIVEKGRQHLLEAFSLVEMKMGARKWAVGGPLHSGRSLPAGILPMGKSDAHRHATRFSRMDDACETTCRAKARSRRSFARKYLLVGIRRRIAHSSAHHTQRDKVIRSSYSVRSARNFPGHSGSF